MAEIDDLNPDLDPTPEPKESDVPLGESGKKALDQERAKRKELEKQIKQYEELKVKLAEVNLDEYEELKALKQKAEQKDLETNKKFQELAEKRQRDIDAQQAKIVQLDKQLAENKKKSAIQKHYYALGGKEEEDDLLTNKSAFDVLYDNVLRDRIQIEADGSVIVLDVGGLAEDRTEGGKPKTPKDLILELTESSIWGKFFAKPDIRGTGITQGVKGRAGSRETFEDMVKRIQKG